MGVRERRARQKSLLKQEILDAARDILVREGYDGLSMRKVAQKIDYSPTAIYLHFKDRDDLVFSVSEQTFAGLVRELEDVAAKHPDPLVALRKGLRRYIDFGLAHPEHYLVAFVVPRGQNPDAGKRYMQPEAMSMRAFGHLPRLVGGVRAPEKDSESGCGHREPRPLGRDPRDNLAPDRHARPSTGATATG